MFFNLFSMLSNFFHLILGINSPQSFPPPLSAEEEKKYFLLMKKGDFRAREKLIVHNLRLVSHIVRKYYASAKNQEDLVSIGTLGLVKAVDTFRVEDGNRFATYAAKCVQNEILMYFRKLKHRQREVSMGDTIDVDREGNPLTYMDVIASEENMTEDVDRKLCSVKALRLVDSVLDARERQIIRLRYGLGGGEPLAQREVAQKLGISRSYVSRLEKAAIDKLYAAMTGKNR